MKFTSLQVRGIFLDTSKAFDMVWQDSVMFTLEQNGVFGNLTDILQYILDNQKQRVVLNWQVSSWANVTIGVPKDQFQAHCSFSSILMIYQQTTPATLNCLLTHH